MQIKHISIGEIKPYQNNPRNNEKAVGYVEKSIREFGFQIPIVIDKDNIIVCGHTRYEAAKRIGINEIPCVIASELTDEQVRAFRIIDNKSQEQATWDTSKLDAELKELSNFDLESFELKIPEFQPGAFESLDFSSLLKDNVSEDDGDDETQEEKGIVTCPDCGCRFKPKKK